MCFYHVQYLCCGMINCDVFLFYSQSIVFMFSWFHAISDIKLYNNCCHVHHPITILSFRIHFVFLPRHVLSQWDSVCIPQFALSTSTSHSTSTISSYLWWWCNQWNGNMFKGDMWVVLHPTTFFPILILWQIFRPQHNFSAWLRRNTMTKERIGLD